jgi:hypothetical protein
VTDKRRFDTSGATKVTKDNGEHYDHFSRANITRTWDTKTGKQKNTCQVADVSPRFGTSRCHEGHEGHGEHYEQFRHTNITPTRDMQQENRNRTLLMADMPRFGEH